MTRRASVLVLLGMLTGCVPEPQPSTQVIDMTLAGARSGVPTPGARGPAGVSAAFAARPAAGAPDLAAGPSAANASSVAALASTAPSDPVREYTAAHPGAVGAAAGREGGVVPASATVPASDAAPAADVSVINSRRVQLNYEVQDVGPSGLASVDLWYTFNGGPWRKYPVAPQAAPFVVEVPGEGRYGFLLLARNHAGQGKAQPDDSDKPQITVEVDQTPPTVRAGCPQYDAQAHTLTLLWEASDRNLGPQPIALLWAREAGGPWTPIITQLANTGRHVWKLPAGLPQRIWLRVEASDLAGNVATADLPAPVVLPADAVPPATAARPLQLPGSGAPPGEPLLMPQVSAVQVIAQPTSAEPTPAAPSRPVLTLEPLNE